MDTEALATAVPAALAAGRDALRAAAGALAPAVAADRDAQQPAGFRLARLHALVHAADVVQSTPAPGELERLLALRYAGEVLQALRAELPLLAEALPEAGDAADAYLAQPGLSGLIHQALGEPLAERVVRAVGPAGRTPDAGLGEEHRLLRETFRTFAEREVKPVAEALHREDRLIPDALIQSAAALGCFGLSIPAEHGGVAEQPDTPGMVLVTEELSRGALAVGSLITRPEILAKALLQGGTPAQQARYLPPMASGESMVCIAVTEPDTGSDVARITTRAEPVEGGWRLNGSKLFSTFAGRAELLGVLARSEPDPALGHRGLSMFVLEKPAAYGHDFVHEPAGGGRLSGRAIPTAGYRGMHSFELTFEDCFVPAGGLVGGEASRGRGFYLQMASFAYGRVQTAGRALGVMQAAYEAACRYAAERRLFGTTLAGMGLTRDKLTHMAAALHACRLATYDAARRLDAGGGQAEASLVKLLACREAEWVTREAQQLHGGMGYAEETAVSRLFVDARVLSIFEGAEEVLALRVVLPALLKEA